MFQNLFRSSRSTSRMPVSLSEWRVRIGTYVPRMLQYHNLVRNLKQFLFLALLQTLADGQSNGDPSEKQEMGSTSDHQSSTDKTSSTAEKGESSTRGCDEQETSTSDNTKAMPCKTSKKRKRRSHKGTASERSSGSFMSFRCFMKSIASPLLRFMLLVFTVILLVRSGDVEVNPGPNESTLPDRTLLDIANRIPQDKMTLLGVELGVNVSALRRYRATNAIFETVTCEGTFYMLVDWRDNTTLEQQEELLRNALNASSLQAVAEEYLPQASRANLSPGPSNLKRTASGTPVQSAQVPMNSTSSSNASLAMPSTSGHTSTNASQNPSVPSSNCNNPISQVQLEKCIADIQDYYRVHLFQISTSPLDPDSLVELQSIFTNLSLLREDRSEKKKIPLKYEDLLTVDISGRPAKRIMIQGEAGVGKTTFCAKIASDWVNGEHFNNFTLVAVVPLRDAKNGKTVGQVLETYLPDDNNVTSEQLDDYIKTNQGNVLILLDGFDELGTNMSTEGNQIVQILKGERQTSGTIIVTTRPWKILEITTDMRKQYAFVNIEGFKRKDIKTYVQKFYRNDEASAKNLLQFFEEGSLIIETMAPFPIFCAMLCHMWSEDENREVIRKLQTFSQLFQEMIMFLKQHYATKHTEEVEGDSIEYIGEEINGQIKKISEIAFDGLLEKQLVFPEKRFNSCAKDLHVACEVGILTKERTKCIKRDESARKLARLESTVSFPHKLFQEYTAGLYLQDLYHSNKDDFDHQMKSRILKKVGEFKNLLYFVGSFDENIAKYIVTELMTQRGRNLNFIVEVALECHWEEAAKLVEAQHPEINHRLTIKKGTSRHVIAGYLFTFRHLVSLHIETFCSSKALLRIIADTVSSVKSLKRLKLEKCTLVDEFITSMEERAKDVMIESLQIDHHGMSESASQTLGVSICAMPCLQDVKLRGKLSDGFYSALRKGALSLKVESLQIADDYMSESSSQTLGASICVMPCLKDVQLTGKLSEGFYNELREGASSLQVESLQIEDCGISESASQTLGASICAMTYLKDVKLSGKLSDGFYNVLREGASSLKVESLQIDDNDISESAAQTLGASICAMPYLKDVQLIGKLSDEFYSALSEGASSLKITLRKKSGGSSSSEVISSSIQINIKLKAEHIIAFVASLSSSQTSSAQVESFQIDDCDINESASQTLGAGICAMPYLKDVQLIGKLPDGFYSALSEGASSLKVESLQIHDRGISESASQTLGASICVMPCLKDVKLRGNLSDGFYIALSKGASSLKMKQMHLMGATLDSCHLSTIALLPDLKSLTLFDIKIDDRNHTEMDGSDSLFIHSSTSLTELNVDHKSFISLQRIGLLKRFPCIQKMTLEFHGRQTPFPQELTHRVTMPDVTDLSLHGFYRNDLAEIDMLSLEPFPNITKLSLMNIFIRNAKCTTILNSLRNNKTLKTISIKNCYTDAGLDSLVNEINAEGKMMVTVEHGEPELYLELKYIFQEL